MVRTKEDKWANVYGEARAEFDRISSSAKPVRDACRQDRHFYSIEGSMWLENDQLQFANRPRFEFNRVLLSVIRIFNEWRNNRVTVDFIPKDGGDDAVADLCDSLFRADVSQSGNEPFDTAFEEAVGGGFGAFRIRAVYEDEGDPDDDRQRIEFEPIPDADTCVYFDLTAKRQDKADAKCCFVLTAMTREAFQAEWGDDPATWPLNTDRGQWSWYSHGANLVYVAEYYKVEEAKEKHVFYELLDGSEEKHTQYQLQDDDGKLAAELEQRGAIVSREKTVKIRKVHKWIMSGDGILEDCGHIAGDYIPIIPVYGKRFWVNGVEYCMGHVRPQKDAARVANMMISRVGEIAAQSGTEKPIFGAEQIGPEAAAMWANDAVEDRAYLLADPLRNPDGSIAVAGPLGFTKPPTVPPALAALIQIVETIGKEIQGQQQQGDDLASNISGKAVELIQTRLDGQSFIYISNMAESIKHAGKVWLSMARDIYVEEGRAMRVLAASGDASSVTLKQSKIIGGVETVTNDLTKAKFDVIVDVGPASASKRAAEVRALTGMMAITSDPEMQMVLQTTALMNMEGEGISDLRKYARKRLLAMGAVEPTEAEKEEAAQAAAQPKPPSADEQLILATAQKEAALAVKAEADTALAGANAQKSIAQAAQIASEIGSARIDTATRAAQPIAGAAQPPSAIRIGEIMGPQ